MMLIYGEWRMLFMVSNQTKWWLILADHNQLCMTQQVHSYYQPARKKAKTYWFTMGRVPHQTNHFGIDGGVAPQHGHFSLLYILDFLGHLSPRNMLLSYVRGMAILLHFMVITLNQTRPTLNQVVVA